MKTKSLRFIVLSALLVITANNCLTTYGQRNPDKVRTSETKPGAWPDLVVVSADFDFSKAQVQVKNIGTVASAKTDLLLELLASYDPASKVTAKFNKAIPALPPGASHKVEFDIGSLTFANHGRRLIVDDTKLVDESNEQNNGLFSKTDPWQQTGDFPSAGGSPDLSFTKVKFTAPAGVYFCVQNTGKAPSSSFKIRVTIFAGPARSGNLWSPGHGSVGVTQNPYSAPYNSLNDGAFVCDEFTFATVGDRTLEGRGRLIQIIPDNPALDVDKSNNFYFSPGQEGLWKQ
jgi:CARDB protein